MFEFPKGRLTTWNSKPACHRTCIRDFMLWGRQTASLALSIKSNGKSSVRAVVVGGMSQGTDDWLGRLALKRE